ncbi:MAG TPA: hypothetical protein VH637_03975 [Streptosporangiaceae bacterium]|jgi:hypothetical protein
MNRRAQLTIFLVAAAAPVLALAVVASGGVAAASPGAASQAAARHPVTLRLLAQFTAERDIDTGPAGLSIGDEQVASGRLRLASGTPAGTFGFTCTTVAVYAHGTAELCAGWAALPAGQLEVTGKSRAQDTVHHWAVTGGTGGYRAARGTLTARDLSPVSDVVTIRLG